MANDAAEVVVRRLLALAAVRDADGGSDHHLLGRFVKHRDEAAFGALLERHGPMVLGIGRRVLRDEPAAEDVLQATFLVLARNAARIRVRSSLGGWLHGVALRLARKAAAEANPDAPAHGLRFLPDGRIVSFADVATVWDAAAKKP